MTDNPDKIYLIVANNFEEAYMSESLMTLRKIGNKVKAQFAFSADTTHRHPLTYAALYVDNMRSGIYKLKPPITDIRTVKALNFEWEI
jgi:hypothetical protein